MGKNELYNYVNHQYDVILVLGNGFDLNCGLKSSFNNFYKATILDNKNMINDKVLRNIWYLLLYLCFYAYKDNVIDTNKYSHLEVIKKENPLWMDIETFIKKIVTGYSKNKDNNGSTKTKIITYLYNQLNNDVEQSEHLDDLYIRRHFQEFYSKRKNKTYADLYLYLLSQLQIFEKQFADYILLEVSNNGFYNANSERLLDNIVDFDTNKVYVIDFNYTGFSLEERFKTFFNTAINKIHGDAKKEVIIGFDSSDVDYSDNNYKGGLILSKSWQILNQENENEDLPNEESIKYIIFYGHSLGEQDYSYFHTLFDKYNLYNGHVILVFCYSDYEDTKTKIIKHRMEYLKNIHALLNDYAVKSGKETSKCITLVNRLELEKRIYIRKIDNSLKHGFFE